jgi:hypothetical protein
MSTWYEIKNKDDLDLSDDKKNLQIEVSDVMGLPDYFGSTYLEIPIEFIKSLIEGK